MPNPVSPTPTTRFGQAMNQALHGDLKRRGVFTAEQRFAVALAGTAALPLPAGQRTAAMAALLSEGMAPAMAEDILIQMAAYLGYPRADAALAALAAAGGRLSPLAGAAGDDDARYAAGTGVYGQLNPHALKAIQTAFGEIAGDVVGLTFRSFGDVFASSAQPLTLRQLATVAGLSVLGTAQPQLKFHMGAALNVGVTQAQLVEAVIWVQFLAGMPAAYNALTALKEAIDDGTEAPPGYQ